MTDNESSERAWCRKSKVSWHHSLYIRTKPVAFPLPCRVRVRVARARII